MNDKLQILTFFLIAITSAILIFNSNANAELAKKNIKNIPIPQGTNIINNQGATELTPYSVVRAYIKRTSTTATTRPNAPNQKVIVPPNTKLLNLSLIFDANFKLAGKIDLLINNSTFLSIDAGDITDTDIYTLDLYTNGLELQDFQNVELYAWTSNASACAVTLSLTLGV